MSMRSRPGRIVTGEYSVLGYAVLLCTRAGAQPIYTAGNHPQDSQVVTPAGVGLRQIRRFCIRTCREIACEQQAIFGGVTRIPDVAVEVST
jgi:hypothetical protein